MTLIHVKNVIRKPWQCWGLWTQVTNEQISYLFDHVTAVWRVAAPPIGHRGARFSSVTRLCQVGGAARAKLASQLTPQSAKLGTADNTPLLWMSEKIKLLLLVTFSFSLRPRASSPLRPREALRCPLTSFHYSARISTSLLPSLFTPKVTFFPLSYA